MGRWMCAREHVRVRSAEQMLSIVPQWIWFWYRQRSNAHTHTHTQTYVCTVVVQSVHAMLGADGEHMHRKRSKRPESFPRKLMCCDGWMV